jgi:signal recognition particle GTPase
MQDNQPLMLELSQIVNMNNPDFIIFIGEALTGNDGSDQLRKFNDSLKNLSSN